MATLRLQLGALRESGKNNRCLASQTFRKVSIGGAEVYAYNSRAKTNARQILATFKQLFIMAMLAALLISPSMARAQTITSFSPTSGPEDGGTVVTINGTGFTNATTVRFGGVLAQSVAFVSSTQITAVTPASSFGNATVDVSTGSTPFVANTTFNYDMTGGGVDFHPDRSRFFHREVSHL
jgi:hypothetical protein